MRCVVRSGSLGRAVVLAALASFAALAACGRADPGAGGAAAPDGSAEPSAGAASPPGIAPPPPGPAPSPTTAVPEVTLVETDSRKLEARSAAPRVVIAPSGIYVGGGRAVPLRDWQSPEPAAEAQDPYAPAGLLEPLERAAAAEKARSGAAEPDAGGEPPRLDLDLELAIDRDAPSRWMLATLITAQSAGFTRFLVVLRGRSGEGVLESPAPRVPPGRRIDPNEPTCVSPMVALSPLGAMVTLGIGVPGVDIVPQPTPTDLRRWAAMAEFERRRARRAASHPRPGEPQPDEPPLLAVVDQLPPPAFAKWYGKVLVGPEKQCPSLRANPDGTSDLGRLSFLLAEAARVAPGCTVARVKPELDTRWSEVARVTARILDQGDFARVIYAAPQPGAEPELESCADALVVRSAPRPGKR